MPIDPITGTLIAEGVVAATQAVTRGGPRRQYKWNKKAANDANQMNRDNAIWALEENRKIQNEQRVYDSPEAQMARYKAAGLNPHLIYGSGSSSGGAFPISTGAIAPSRIDAPDASYPDVAGSFLQAGQTLAQTGLASQKIDESQAKSELLSIQIDIAKTNPMLDKGVAEWVSTQALETARLKSLEARQWMTTEEGTMRIQKKVNAEVEQLVQRLGLNTADLQIKNRILQSKEFENAVKKVQADWLKDGDLSPEHIRQGFMLILSKMIGR